MGNLMKTFILLIIVLYVKGQSLADQFNYPKIAIVGGGIGGTSCAYFLKEVFQDKVEITIFERDDIGGRLNLVDINGNKYESGGAVIHPRNKYMMDFTNLLGLPIKRPASTKFGIYDGEKLILEESDWYIVSIAQFIWRYGVSIFELWKDVKWMLDNFSRIYSSQEAGYSFTTVNSMLEHMNEKFRNLTQVTLLAELQKRSYSKNVLAELVQSVMKVNYGQTNNISAFAGFVSLAGADSNLWSVSEGNKMVPEGLLKKSNALFVNADVFEVELLENGAYHLIFKQRASAFKGTEGSYYNYVIIACPLIKGQVNIKFTNFKKDMEQYQSTFHRTVATFIKGSLNPAAFNAKSIPDEILVCQAHSLFNSIGIVSPVNEYSKKEDSKVYKVFSSEPLTPKTIHTLFENVEIIKEKDWLAYPHYEPPEKLLPFLLYPGLYYINAIESSASAMEMSAIGAKNVALLAFNLHNNLLDKVDHYKRIYKEEL